MRALFVVTLRAMLCWLAQRRISGLGASFVAFVAMGLCGAALPLSGCERDTTVPFKRPNAETQARTESVAAPGAGDSTNVISEQESPTAMRFAAAPSSIQIGDSTVTRKGGHIHAALSRRLEPDRSDVLLLVSDEKGALFVERSKQQGGAYGAPAVVLSLPEPASQCQTLSGSLAAPSHGHLLVEATFTCPIAPEREGTDDQLLMRAFYVLSREEHPRLMERVDVRTSSQGADEQAPLGIRADIKGVDVDQDGHDDVQLILTPSVGDQVLDPIAFDLIDRPGGLVWDREEPEASLRALADQAHKVLGRSPDRAILLSGQVRDLHRALCRDAGGALVDVGGNNGIPCQPSAGLGRALAVSMAAHSKRGDVLDVLALQAQLKSPQVRLLGVDEKRSQKAVEQLPREGDIVFVQGPTVRMLPLPAEHRSRVAFIDEHHLLLRGEPPESYSLSSGERLPTSVVAPSALLTDPSGRYVASEIVRDCSSDRLRVFPAGQVVMGRSMGVPAVELTIRVSQGGEACQDQRQGAGSQTSELKLLRWSGSRLLFVEADRFLLLTVDDALHSSEPAHELQPSESLPTALEPDLLATAPPQYAWATPVGIAIMDVATHKTRLLRSEGLPANLDEVALSPSGKQIAALSGDRVWLGHPRTP